MGKGALPMPEQYTWPGGSHPTPSLPMEAEAKGIHYVFSTDAQPNFVVFRAGLFKVAKIYLYFKQLIISHLKGRLIPFTIYTVSKEIQVL